MKKSEREAAARAVEIVRRASGRSEVDADYGTGKLTKAQKKSQEKHIPFTSGPQTRIQRAKRALWG